MSAARRRYEETHRWITFEVNLTGAPHSLWFLLGEASSKCDHLASTPLQPSVAAKLHQLYLAKGALATTAIEGNTLSEAEVLAHLAGELTLPKSKEYLATEVDNIIKACEALANSVHINDARPLTVDTICGFNRQVLKDLPLDEGVIPGEIREHNVTVGRYRGAPADDCRYLLECMCEWLNGDTFKPPKDQPEMQLPFALIKAGLAHLYLAWIHPFGDGNGRTARLLEFQILLDAGAPSPAAHLLSNHYNQTRAEYYRQLDRTSQTGGEVIPFLLYAVQGFVDGIREQIAVVRRQLMRITWDNYVHEQFLDSTSPADIRRRQLVLDLARALRSVKTHEIPELTPKLAQLYAGKTSKTLTRDLHELVAANLIVRSSDGIKANTNRILQFLPLKKRTNPPLSPPQENP